MPLVAIGRTILELRRVKEITQEVLASAVGVSAQAVSKWESGGTPDVELLPHIADYFGISLDTLFGRDVDYGNLEKNVAKAIARVPRGKAIEAAFDCCWAIESGLMGNSDEIPNLQEIAKHGGRPFSRVLCDNGFTTMALSQKLRYFLLMPEPSSGWKHALGAEDQYVELFRFLGDPTIFATLYYLNERDNKPFTPKLIERLLDVDEKIAMSCIDRLLAHKFLRSTTIELDDELKTVYQLIPNPAFIGLLAMCQEIVNPPGHFRGYMGGRNRPYLAATPETGLVENV